MTSKVLHVDKPSNGDGQTLPLHQGAIQGARTWRRLSLTQITLLNSPAEGCIIQGDPRRVGGAAAPNKSLFTVPEGYGLPDRETSPRSSWRTSLLDETDHYLTETLGLDIDRYVDDTATVDRDKEKLLLAMPLIREHLWQTAEVRV